MNLSKMPINSPFFYRDYMDYHADRFTDHSLMIYDKNKVTALLPANENDQTISSHQGLSYGGVISTPEIKQATATLVIKHILNYYKKRRFDSLLYKQTPGFYLHRQGSEDGFALRQLGAQFLRSDLNSVIDYNYPLPYQKRRKRGIQKGIVNQIDIKPHDDVQGFWNLVLKPNLVKKHGIQPTHTLEEITRLQTRFPKNIIQYNAYLGTELLAGTTVFVHPHVAHAQYISATALGQSLGALDLLFDRIIRHYSTSHRYFSFGISTYQEGQLLNQGLLDWKEGFGARAWEHRYAYVMMALNSH